MNFRVLIQAHSDLNYIFECGFCKSQLVHPTLPAFILSLVLAKPWNKWLVLLMSKPTTSLWYLYVALYH